MRGNGLSALMMMLAADVDLRIRSGIYVIFVDATRLLRAGNIDFSKDITMLHVDCRQS